MITIYNSTETTFLSDGLGLIDNIVTDAAITEELNGAYFLELTAIIDDDGLFELLDYDNIIKASGQLFRILDIDKDSSFITVKALHIFYDLSNNFLEDVAPTDKNGGDALRWILARTQYPNSFQGSSDIANIKTARYVRYSPTDAIMGNLKNSMLNTWGGELRRNNYAIELLTRLGADNGVEISYGKNITGITESIIKNNVVTRIMPQGFDGLLIPEKYVDSQYILSYPMPIIRKVEFPEIKVNDNPANGPVLNEEQAQEELRLAAQAMFTVDKIDLPLVNYKVSFIDLTQTEEYKDYKVLESVSLGDTVAVNQIRMKLTVSARCIKTVWDVLGKRYRNIELGNFNQNLQSYIKQVTEKAQESIFMDALMEASQLIREGLGGYVVKTRDELLIMDTDDVTTATEVWRWNKNGLGYSSTGYNGIYGLALTKDGKINASMIKTGKLLAEFIEAVSLSAISADLGTVTTGKLKSTDGTIEIDLDNGIMSFKSSSLATESYVDISSEAMELKFNNIQTGGENLLSKSATMEDWGVAGGASLDSINGWIYMPANGNEQYGRWVLSVESGRKYVFSVDVWTDNINTPNALRFYWKKIGDAIWNSYLFPISTNNLKWERTEAAFEITGSSGVMVDIEILVDCYYATTGKMWYRKPQLEAGTKGSPWKPSPNELYSGITKIDKDGVNVSVSSSGINSQLAYNGLEIKDGTKLVAVFGDTGAVIPTFEADEYACPVIAGVINNSGTYNVGSGQTYSSVSYVLQTVLKNRKILNDATLIFQIYGTLNEMISIKGYTGSGSIHLRFMDGAVLNGNITGEDNSIKTYIKGTNAMGAIKRTTKEPVIANNCYVNVTSMNLDCGVGGGAGILGSNGAMVKCDNVDISNANWCIIMTDGATGRCKNTRGNALASGLVAQNGSVIHTWGTSPNAGPHEDSGTIHGTLKPTASTFSVPPVTAKTFTAIFGPSSLYTVNHDTASVDSYYGATAAQGRYSGMSYWKDGVMTFGSDIYNYWQGGYNVLVEMRVRRKNSSHGTSAGVVPQAYNFSPSEAFNAIGQGVWSEWTTVPAAVFGSGGAALKFYNGNLNSGYAIFDACEVKVTVTKDV